MRRHWTIPFLAKALLIGWFITANCLHLSVGLADNGDFLRSTQMFSSGPVGTASGEPLVDTPDFARRYFHAWLPFWKVDFQLTTPKTSAIILWAPGIGLNLAFRSRDVFSVPLLSLVPRCAVLGLLVLLFGWMERRIPRPTLARIAIGVPLTLMLTTTDTLAYQNSFYQEGGALIYLLLTLACLMAMRIRASWNNLAGTFVSLGLLATSKSAYVYWPFLAIPFVYLIWRQRDRLQARVLVIIAVLASLMLVTGGTGVKGRNSFHSLFYGALPFSSDPASHLRRLGLEELAGHVDDRAYASVGSVSFMSTVNVIAHEQAIFGRMLMHTSERMQDASLDYLGKYADDDPRSVDNPTVLHGMEDRFWGAPAFSPLNAWSTVKYALFPTGVALLVVLFSFVTWFLFCPRLLPSCPEIPLAGLVATLGCAADMLVAILGDGKFELIKHLFLANVLFDIAAIAFVSSALLSVLRLRDRT